MLLLYALGVRLVGRGGAGAGVSAAVGMSCSAVGTTVALSVGRRVRILSVKMVRWFRGLKIERAEGEDSKTLTGTIY